MKTPRIHFVLRTLYSSFDAAVERRHTIETAKQMGCDRVMLFNSRGHCEPAHLDRDEVLRRAAVMKAAAGDVRRAGLGAGINNLATVGMNFSPPRKHPLPYQHLVDSDGATYRETFCPLDREFQKYLEFVYAAWTSAGPDEVWIDDDFRYKTNCGQCFCPLHLRAFGKMTGRKWTREQVLKALASDTALPNPLMIKWGQLQQAGLFELAAAIARGVKKTDRRTRIAFMGIRTSIGFYGSGYLRRLSEILSPEQPFLVRPEYGGYSDECRNIWNTYIPVWACVRSFGGRFEPWPELESWPYAGFNHSRKIQRMKVLWAALHGFASTTVNTSWDRETARMIRRCRQDAGSISRTISAADLRPAGVSLELSENITGLHPRPGPIAFDNLSAVIPTRLGIPLWPEGRHGRILTGNSPLVREKELSRFAKEGMVLDRPAFETLCAMKRADLLGAAGSRPMGGIPVREIFSNDRVNGSSADHAMSMEMAIGVRPKLLGFDLPDSAEYRALSDFVDSDGLPLSAGVWTREWRGGRIAVLPYSLSEPTSEHALLNRFRKIQLESLLEWVSRRPLPVKVAGAPDLAVICRQSRSRIVIGLANYSHDAADRYALTIPALRSQRRITVRMQCYGSTTKRAIARVPVREDGTVTLGGRFSVPSMEVRLLEIDSRR
jgi:hypothetical protein